MNKQRNISLDIAKAVCTLMVVFLHAGENNAIETYIKIICTCAVPFFFLVSGYYLSLNVANGKTEYAFRQLKKIGVHSAFFHDLAAFFQYSERIRETLRQDISCPLEA